MPKLDGCRFCDEDYPWNPDEEVVPASVAFFEDGGQGQLKRAMWHDSRQLL